MPTLEDLVARFGLDGLVNVWPVMLDDGDTYSWELEIDEQRVPGVYAQARKLGERTEVVMILEGGEAFTLHSWQESKGERRPAGLLWTLRQLREIGRPADV